MKPVPWLTFPAMASIATVFQLNVAAASTMSGVSQDASGICLSVGGRTLRVEVVSDSVVRVAAAKDPAFFARESLMLDPQRPKPAAVWSLSGDDATAVLSTAALTVRVDRATGRVGFLDRSGTPIAAERAGGRTFTPAVVQGEATQHVRQVWEAQPDESLFGLGQHQLGLLDIKGCDLDLWQANTTVAIPFLVSSRGYGILWDNNGYTRFGDLREPAAIPAELLFDANGKPGGLTASYFADETFGRRVATRRDASLFIPRPDFSGLPENAAELPLRVNRWISPEFDGPGRVGVRWEGAVEAAETGEHTFHSFANGGLRVWVDGRLVIDHWRQDWLPWKEVARVRLEAGHRHALKVEWVRDGNLPTFRLRWKTPPASADTALWSEVGDGLDYYFVYGPTIDAVIAGYRRLTGAATLLPKWAFGFWQSRQRYETQQQSLDVVREYRRRGIPLDVIVQDWFYWTDTGWGSHEFDPQRFPDPSGWIRSLHEDLNARLLISVWPKFYPGTRNFDAMQSRGFLYQPNLAQGVRDWLGKPYTFYDAFNPEARELFWAQIDLELFSRKVDAWWLDGCEPDLLPAPSLDGAHTHMMPTAAGTAARVLNAFPMQNARAVFEGQRASSPDQRVVILTRSGFAGQQRFAAAVWSGDVSSTWTALRKQIPAGLGFALSGLPYWTMDSGGFAVPERFSRDHPLPEDVEEWRELNTRWLQFAAFLPLFRSHGEKPLRELWEFGGESHPAYAAQLKIVRLRYRLLPYIYSVAGAVAHEGGSFLRPLVVDFPGDAVARATTDQFAFGPALFVSPVTTHQARSRSVYLPAIAGGWYDFWTGAALAGGRTIDAPAPYDALPVHVRAGSIVPLGPELQWAMEKSADPLTLLVYTGADAAFALYEDDGLTNGHERGAFARIPLRWEEASRTLTLGTRQGSFPGMLATRTFEVVFVTPDRPAAHPFATIPAAVVRYDGAALTVRCDTAAP